MRPLNEKEAVAVTNVLVDMYDCPWCIAKKGEYCYAQRGGFGSGGIVRDVRHTHLARLWLYEDQMKH